MFKSSAAARARGDPTTPRMVPRDLPEDTPQTEPTGPEYYIKPAKVPCHRTMRPRKSSMKPPKEPEVNTGRPIPISTPFHCWRERLKSPGPSTPPPAARPLAPQDSNRPVIPPAPQQPHNRHRLSSEPPRPAQMAPSAIPVNPYVHAVDMHRPTASMTAHAPPHMPAPAPAPAPVPARSGRDNFRASEKQPVQENTSKNAERQSYEPIPSHAPLNSERAPYNYSSHRDYGATQTHNPRYAPPAPQTSGVRHPGSYIYGPPQAQPSHAYPYQGRPSHGGGGGYPDPEAMKRQYSAPQPAHVDPYELNGRLQAVQQDRQRTDQHQHQQHLLYQQQAYEQQQQYHRQKQQQQQPQQSQQYHRQQQQQQPQQPSQPQSSQLYGQSTHPATSAVAVREMFHAQGLDENGNPPGGGPRPGPLPAVIAPQASIRPSAPGPMQPSTKSVPHYLSAPAFLRPMTHQDGELFPSQWTIPRPGKRGGALAWPLAILKARKVKDSMVFFDISQDPNDARPGKGVRVVYRECDGRSERLPPEAKQLEVLQDDKKTLYRIDMACCMEELEDWSVIIENPEQGIRVTDVMTAIYETYRKPLTPDELRRHHGRVNTEACRKAFERRCARSADPQGTRARGMARVDLMGDKTLYHQMHFNDVTLRYELYLEDQDQNNLIESKAVRLFR
ncbi:hypothetical protein H0H92_014760 [Tricholoma furcatifolium]|nr:hypothetical protein H0H92_014760 [Tricholoma furcatifolium]